MASKSFPQSLTLIVAATSNMGIGRAGTLPWLSIKSEMAYFARTTKRVSLPFEASSPRTINAVIMGRKTYESIPPKFRPLKARLNIVVTRQSPAEALGSERAANDAQQVEEGPLVVPSLDSALQALSERQSSPNSPKISRIFVIGGAQIYAEALQHPSVKRIMLTRINKEYECDTLFPLVLPEGAHEGVMSKGWIKRGDDERNHWLGEEKVGDGEEGWEVEMWEWSENDSED